jgi:subtilisin family serine protease
MLLSMLAVPVMGTSLSTAESTQPDQADATSGEPVTISQAVEESDGMTQVVLRFDGNGGLALSASDTVEELKSEAQKHRAKVQSLADRYDGLEVEYTSWLAQAVLVEVDTDSKVYKKLQRVEGLTQMHANFEVDVPPQGPSKPVAEPTDTNTTYGLEQVDAVEAWTEFDTKGEGAKVAVLDTGVDASHQDIDLYTENASDPTYPGGWAEFNASGVQLNSTPRDDDQHGTHTSGTVSGGNASGKYVGVAPNVDLMHGMVLGDAGGTFTAVVAGMEWAVQEDADIISMSLGTPGGGFDPNLIEPVQNARAAGTFVIASAGNAGEGVTGSPGNVYESLSIGASNEDRDIAQFSSGQVIDTDEAWGDAAPEAWPETYINPDVSAPGVQVVSTVPNNEYGPLSGTSMAAPHVAGVAALIQSADPDVTPQEIGAVLRNTATKPDDAPNGKDVRYGTGIVDADAAVAAAVYDSGIEGTVTSNGEPVADAVVKLQNGPRAVTDANGSFSLTVGPGEKQLTVSGFGIAETTTNVTVQENQTTTVTIETEPTLDVNLVEPQTSAVKAGTAANLTVDVANVESLTIDLAGNYSTDNATLLVAGDEVPFGETLTFDGGLSGRVPVSVKTAPNATGEFTLEHTFGGLGSEISVTTGPTSVFAELIEVGVVDGGETPQTTQTIEALETEMSAQYVFEFVKGTNAIDAIDQYDAFVVQNFADDDIAGEFMQQTNAQGTGVVLLDQWGNTSNAIPQASEATGTPQETAEGDLGPTPVKYKLKGSHPIVDDVGSVGENVSIHTGSFADHSWFEGIGSAKVLAAVGDDSAIVGDALAVDEYSNIVYASTLGRTSFVQNSDFTDTADTILGNSVEFVATNEPEAAGAMTIEDTEVAKDGMTKVTVGTTAPGVAGYQANISFDPETVEVTGVSGLNFSDPIVNVNNEAGYVSIAQAQSSEMDAPDLAEVTFESTTDTSGSTTLSFNTEKSLVNDRNGNTIQTTYQDGSVTVLDCTVGDVNGDDQVTSGDVTLMQRHIVGEDVDINTACGDTDGDGAITAGDVIGVLQKIVGKA